MLEIRNLTKIYKPKKGVPVKALDQVNLKFPKTGMVFVLGKSGSGKSTLLNLLGGLDTYTDGEIIIKGKSSKDFTQSDFDSYRNTYVGFIFQEYNILEEFTVGANIALAMELQGKKATNEAINQILAEVDLEGYGNRKPNELSGGQMQRVAIARALVKNPEIIMADEPTGALDSKTGIQVFNTLKKLSKTKLVIVVSHDREFAEQYADRIVEFADGKIISDVEKTLVDAVEYREGVSVIDDQFIKVKQGYRLTQADLDLINEYLAKAQSDMLISLDGQVNQQLKRMAKIDDEGNREVFSTTDQSKIKLSTDGQFKLIKSKLPLKDSLRLGASGLKGKPIRLFLTIFLSLIAFTLFGLADTLGSYDKVANTVRSIQDSKISNLTFRKKHYFTTAWGRDNRFVNMTEADLQFLSQKLGVQFKPIYSSTNDEWNLPTIIDNIYDQSMLGSRWSSYYQAVVSGYVEYTEAEIRALGFTYYGTWPSKNDQVAITKYMYDHFKACGYYDGSQAIQAEDVTMDKLIGKPLFVDGETYYISAILDTNLDPKGRYEVIKNNRNSNSIIDYMMYEEFRNVIYNGFHSLLYVNPGVIANLASKNKKVGVSLSDFGMFYLYNNQNPYSIDYFTALKDLDRSFVHFFESGKEKLEENEVLIDARLYFDEINKLNYIPVSPEIKKKYFNITWDTNGDFLVDRLFAQIKEYADNDYQNAYQRGFDPIKYYPWLTQAEVDADPAYWYYYHLLHQGYVHNSHGEAVQYRLNTLLNWDLYIYGYMSNELVNTREVYQSEELNLRKQDLSEELKLIYPEFTTYQELLEYLIDVEMKNYANEYYETAYQNGFEPKNYFPNLKNEEVLGNEADWYYEYLFANGRFTNPYGKTGEEIIWQATKSFLTEFDLMNQSLIEGYDAYINAIIDVYNAPLSETIIDQHSDFSISNMDDLIRYLGRQAIRDYAYSHVEEAVAKGFDPSLHFGGDIEVVEIADWYYQFLMEGYSGYNTNPYGESGVNIDWNRRLEVLIDVGVMPTALEDYSLNAFNRYQSGEEMIEIKVAGLLIPYDKIVNRGWYGEYYLVIDDQYYEQFKSGEQGPYIRAIAKMPNSSKDIEKAVRFNYFFEENNVSYHMDNEVSYLLDQVNNLVEQLSKVFLYIGIGFAVFSSLLLFNFITTSITQKKREIGVLRALGSRSFDVFSIFYNESLIITFINYVLAVIATNIVVIILNRYIRNEYGILITFLRFGLRQLIMMLLISILVATISSFLPTYRISHKKPIDAIRNR